MRTFVLFILLAISVALGVGFLGDIHPAFDSLSHFRLHLAVALLVLAGFFGLGRNRLVALAFMLLAAFGIFESNKGLPHPPDRSAKLPDERIYRLFAMNLLWDNPAPQKVFEAISENDPDILFLTEFSRQWERRVGQFGNDYPYRLRCPQWGAMGGSLIMSRYPLETDSDFCGQNGAFSRTTALLDGRKVALGAVHLRWPWPGAGSNEIAALGPALAKLGPDAIVAGDYNAASWSLAATELNEAGGLRLVEGIGPSWGPTLRIADHNRQWPQWLGLPIDNAAAKGAVTVVAARRLASAGSDHLPLQIDFVLRQ
jgi:endonuclease/exonuclease/phosphatase (EEP) superfamily protein YafD